MRGEPRSAGATGDGPLSANFTPPLPVASYGIELQLFLYLAQELLHVYWPNRPDRRSQMRYRISLLTIAAVTCMAFGFVNAANAQNNEPPPAGPVIDQLTGQPIISTYTTRTVTFAAAAATTNLSFAFREDPAFLLLDNVSLIDLSNPSGNLVVNGDFEAGPLNAQAPTGWSYLNIFGAAFGGVVNSGCGNPGNCYYDGAVQAYDAISQLIATNPGDTYLLSYDYADNCAGSCGTAGDVTVYQAVSDNGQPGTGGNGRDMFVYAGALPTPAPEPASLALLGTALAGFGWLRRRKA